MDTQDRSEADVPGLPSGGAFAHPDWAVGGNLGPPPRAGRRSIIGGLAGHWWRILSLWVLASTPVAYMIYALVEPTYEAVSLLRAEPTTIDLYGPELRRVPDHSADRIYLLTQVKLMTSNQVLDAALANPGIANEPMIRSSRAPKETLRERMRVEILGDNTYLLEVTLASKDPVEAAAIVNAVVKAYIDQHADYHQKANWSLRLSLTNEQEKLSVQIETTQYKLARMAEEGRVRLPEVDVADPPAGKGDAKGAVESSLRRVTEPQLQEMSNRLIQADFDLIDARTRVDAARLAKAPADRIQSLESAVVEADLRRGRYKRYLAGLQVASRTAEVLRVSLMEQDLTYLRRLRERITEKLNQLEFEIGQVAYRVTVQDKAAVPRTPSDNRRLSMTAKASVVILLLIVGAFLVRGIPASRRDAADAPA